ncbi:MAG: hypothetical protein K5905_06785 [Roseibium sp.]|uniref:hypothetical protein n=1 Tax=Roseibium sp. TaxID=1936156 RepID=UPI00260D04A6|nr:hypothetical protein [Roseibium sp.]MCV0425159.1 hypothetical protein [Roseibium sp.]
MKRLHRIRTAIYVLLILGVGYALGFFFGSMLPSPGYLAYLDRMPLEMNSPEDVSWVVKRHLPKDALDAFEVVADSSSETWVYQGRSCDCTLITFKRVVSRLPLPDRELSITFRLEDGELEYEEASVVIWFL